VGTTEDQFLSAFAAEFPGIGVFRLTLGAFHLFSLRSRSCICQILFRPSLRSGGKGVDFAPAQGERAKLGLVTFHLSSNVSPLLRPFGCSIVLLWEEFVDILQQTVEILFNDAPDDQLLDVVVTVGQDVSE